MIFRKIRLKRFVNAHDSNKRIRDELKNSNCWVMFGDYDLMYEDESKEISDSDVCYSVLQHGGAPERDATGYSCDHVLSLVAIDEQKNTWDHENAFICLVRLHFLNSAYVVGENAAIQDFIEKCKNRNFSIYRTSELSDLVLVGSSNNLGELLDAAFQFSQEESVGKVYTYFGVRTIAIGSKITEPKKKIDFVSMAITLPQSFSVGDKIKRISEIGPKGIPYIMSGHSDVQLVWRDISQELLLDILHDWYVDDKSDSFKNVSIDINTTFGKRLGSTNFPQPADTLTDIQTSCEILYNVLVTIIDEYSRVKADPQFAWISSDWLNSLLEEVKVVRFLSRSSVWDEFVYLIYPSLETFVYKIGVLLKQKESTVVASKHSKARAYVENLSYLINHIIANEGHLSSYPEVATNCYNLPFFFQEYTMAFLNKCRDLLEKKDEHKRNCQLLIIPKMIGQIVTAEIFDGDDGLITIELPFNSLSDTEVVYIQLVHEIAHYVGEYTRCRSERLDCFFNVAAAIIVHYFFGTDSSDMTALIKDKLYKDIPDRSRPISHLINDIVIWTQNTFSGVHRDRYDKLLIEAVKSEKANGIRFLDDTEIYENYVVVRDLIRDLGHLFREAYADLCSIVILQCPIDKYVKILYERIDVNKQQHSDVIFQVLAALVIKRCGYTIEELSGNGNAALDTFLKKANDIVEILNGSPKSAITMDDALDKWQIPSSVVKSADEYLNKCFERFSGFDSEDLRAIRDDYQIITGKKPSDYSHIEDVILDFKKKVCKIQEEE